MIAINLAWATAASKAPVPSVMLGVSGNNNGTSRQDEIGQSMSVLATKARVTFP